MTTLEQDRINQEFEEMKAEVAKDRGKYAQETKERMQREVEYLNDVLSYIQREDIHPDEIAMPMHNLISVAPEEQYRFLRSLQALFNNLPCSVKSTDDVHQYVEAVNKLQKKDTDTKMQKLDISQLYGAYRRIIYSFGIWDNAKQLKAIKTIHKNMLQIANSVIDKRLKGIQTADMIIEQDNNGVQVG